MKKLKLMKIMVISSLLVSAFISNPTEVNAEWKKDKIGWWYTEGSSWSVGWKLIDEKWYYFGQDGYMKTGWIQDSNEKWYYLNSDGSMAHDTTINGYTLDSDGVWIKEKQNILSNVNQNATTISGVTGVKSTDITKIVFYDGRGGINKPITVEDKEKIREFMGYIDGYDIKKTQNPESTGWIQSAKFYVDDEVVMDITFNDPIIINGDYFNIIKGKLDSEAIDKFLKSVDSSYDIM